MKDTKLTFGQFLAKCRTDKGLTQRELGDLLFVGESAVSKWEKDKRRPDLELVTKLSEIFEISESELIKASVDKAARRDKRQAKKFRAIATTYNMTLFVGFAIALFVSFIVNLATEGTLSWSLIVLTAIIVAASVLIVPQYIKKHKIVFTPLVFLSSLLLLLAVINIFSGTPVWFVIPLMALIFVYSLIFVPLLIKAYLPKLSRHNAVISTAISFVVLFLMLIVINAYTALAGDDSFGWAFTIALPVLLFWSLAVFGAIVLIRYAKINWAFKTSIFVLAYLVFITSFMPFASLLGIETDGDNFWQVNFSRWNSDTISPNVMMIHLGVVLIVSGVFLAVGITKYRKTTK